MSWQFRGMTASEHILQRSIPVPECGCWLWEGALTDGYGRLDFAGRKVLAHRLSYQTFRGDIPPGMLVLHRCDVPSCVNPQHLFVGTDADNTRDKMSKARQARGPGQAVWLRGERHPGSVLTTEEVLAIRADERAQSVIGAAFGIYQTHVSLIKRRKIWKHI